MYIDNKVIKQKVSSPYTFDELDGGSYDIKVAAYDKAGNITKSELHVTTSKAAQNGFFQRKVKIPLAALILVLLTMTGLLGYVIRLLIDRHRNSFSYLRNEIQKNLNRKLEINKNLEELKQRMDKANDVHDLNKTLK